MQEIFNFLNKNKVWHSVPNLPFPATDQIFWKVNMEPVILSNLRINDLFSKLRTKLNGKEDFIQEFEISLTNNEIPFSLLMKLHNYAQSGDCLHFYRKWNMRIHTTIKCCLIANNKFK